MNYVIHNNSLINSPLSFNRFLKALMHLHEDLIMTFSTDSEPKLVVGLMKLTICELDLHLLRLDYISVYYVL